METPEYNRFKAYVDRTSRESAQAKRLSLFQALQYGHTSVAALVAAVGGNALLRTWVSQAMKDGEIVRDENGQLRIPSARVDDGCTEAERLYVRAVDASWAWVWALPADSPERERAIHITVRLDVFFDDEFDNAEESDQDKGESEDT